MKLKSLEIIKGDARISSIDVFRAFAILPVVIYHFNGMLPYGYLGVDLFFVISGLLVGSILIRQFKKNEKINFFRFILQRGFKIWPSYYSFLVVGMILAYIFYRYDKPEYLIEGARDGMRYVFFYQNYTSVPFHWPFDHVWSLCVEEHFYILLPLLFIFIIGLFRYNRNMLLFAVIGLIATGIFFKMFTVAYTPGISTYSTTHNRLDALGWGVLLGIFVTYYENYLKKIKWLPVLFYVGLALLVAGVIFLIEWRNEYFQKVIFFSLSPFCFFLMILGLYYHDFSKWKPVRFIAYYSYNWYLWHPIFVLVFSKYIGINGLGLIVYLAVSFCTAMFFTIFVEEKFLSIREKVLGKLFKKTSRAAA